jgi:microcystin-dependent protein
MPSSLILQGGAAQTRTLVDDIVQDSHGLAQGDVVRWDSTSTRYVRALADTPTNAEVVGIVSEVGNSSNFKITYSGYVSIPALASLTDPVLFLSSTVPGGLVGSPPSAVGTVVKPVLTRNTTSGGYIFTNYLGTQIGGSSTISVDEIQPVGTIMPFAGGTIPDTWLPCEGTAYAVADYPELYSKVLRTDGDRAPSYGYVANISVPLALYNAVQVGQIAILRNAGAVDPANYDLIGRITAKTAANNTLTVQILPKYDGTTRTFAFPNSVAVVGANIRAYTNLDLSAQAGSGGVVSAVVLTHFNVPDLRGRFALGSNATAVAENAQEGDNAYNSALSVYNLGSLGGEERHTLTAAEMAQHSHDSGTLQAATSGNHTHDYIDGVLAEAYGSGSLTGTENLLGLRGGDGLDNDNGLLVRGRNNLHYKAGEIASTPAYQNPLVGISGNHTHIISGNVSSVGSNTPHNNMPPYVAVRYIIKAKPYTRAAIIEGIELPYNDLLVRNLRTRNVGGANEDLLFYVNVSGDSGRGTERMRIPSIVGIPSVIITGSGNNDPDASAELRLRENSSQEAKFIDFHSSVSGGAWNPLNVVGGHSIIFGSSTSIGDIGSSGPLTIAPWSNSSHGLVLSSDGRLGINTATPSANLDVSGNAVVSGTLNVGATANVDSLTITKKATSAVTVAADPATTLVTKGYVDGLSSIKIVTFSETSASTGFTSPWTGVISGVSGLRYYTSPYTITLSPGNYRVHLSVTTYFNPDVNDDNVVYWAVQYSSTNPTSINSTSFLNVPLSYTHSRSGGAGHGRRIYHGGAREGSFTINTTSTGRIYLHQAGPSNRDRFTLTGATIILEKI